MYFKTSIWKKEQLLIRKNKRWYDIFWGNFIKKDDIEIHNLEDENIKQILELLKKEKLDYFIRWFNNDYVCTKNISRGNRRVAGRYISNSILWRTRWVNERLFTIVQDSVIKIWQYTVRPNQVFFNFMSEALWQKYILSENEIPKKKYYKKNPNKIDPRILSEKNIFIDFVEKIYMLYSSSDNNDVEKLSNIIERYDVAEMFDLYELGKTNDNLFLEKITCILKENNYKILNKFLIK